MDKHLYCHAKTSKADTIFETLPLPPSEIEFLHRNNVYCKESTDGTYMIGTFALKTLFSR